MDIEKLIESVRLCGSTPKVDQCKQCAYWSGGDMSKCIPRMTTDAATALSTLQGENEKLRVELEQVKRERDTAVKAIERVRSCKDCGHYTGEWTPPCKECQDSEEHHPCFKWRGQKKGCF